MAVESKVLQAGYRVTGSASEAYTSIGKTIIDSATVVNTSADPAKVTIYIVPSGGSIGDAVCVASELSVAPHTTEVPVGLITRLDAGDQVQILADTADRLSLRLTGRRF